MVFGLVLFVHILVSLVLIGVILLQGGKGGLSETLGGGTAQSLFGGGVNTVLTRMTAACASIFVVTCLSLAYLSTVRGRSVIEQVPLVSPEGLPALPGALPPSSTPPIANPAPSAPPAPPPSAPQTPATAPNTSKTPPQ